MDEGDGAGYAYYLVALRIGHKVILPTTNKALCRRLSEAFALTSVRAFLYSSNRSPLLQLPYAIMVLRYGSVAAGLDCC